MVLKKRAAAMLAMLITVCLISAVSAEKNGYVPTSASVSNRKQIILDAGHGGFDGGAVAKDGTVEKDINLNITLTLASFLRQSGYEVVLTRQTDVSTDDVETSQISAKKKSDLKNRLELMKDYPDAVFVSIHLNKFTTSAANGSQVFYSGKTQGSKELGEAIQRSIVARLQPDNSRVNKQATSSTYLLYNATLPAVIVECGFLSNSVELERLKNTEYQKQMAFCIFCGITDYFSLVGL